MLKPLNSLLRTLETRSAWREQRLFRQVLQCWEEIVGAPVAAQTRPLSIYKSILSVATSDSTWSQNLVFQRPAILSKLNARLAHPLADIRFSAAQWHRPESGRRQAGKREVRSQRNAEIWQDHPSFLAPVHLFQADGQPGAARDPRAAFQGWAQRMQARSRHFPLCPHCNCPTPPGEIKRWSLCAFCAAQAWQSTSIQRASQ